MSANGWAEQVLAGIGAPVTQGNVVFIKLWEQAEGTKAVHNPLATTQPMPGATNFNSVGVKNYPTEQAGLEATIKTLKNGRYDQVIEALKAGNAPAAAQAVVASPWGTGKQLLELVGDAGGNAIPQGVTGGIATGVVGAAAGGVKSVAELIELMTKRSTWTRVLLVVGGVAAIGGGLVLLNASTVKKAAGAVGGAVPGVVAGKAVTAGAGAARAAAAAAV